MVINSIAVFCGSKMGNNPLFEEHARQLGYLLVDHKVEAVYGGGNKGLMGAIANSILEKKGKVIGIMPKALTEWEHHHNGITELIIVNDMHTRKKMIYEKCDAAIILPGGFGTMDELYEILTWNQLSLHNKAIFILNSEGFYNHLIAHNECMRENGFLYNNLSEIIKILNEPEELVDYLK
ncbi:MAG: TIGR00730 family Rossman fold protein [Chitinophagaceae bacterium]|nr:TIGR00730 family Rossman fold protein [Chitinophagaceae bacterium]